MIRSMFLPSVSSMRIRLLPLVVICPFITGAPFKIHMAVFIAIVNTPSVNREAVFCCPYRCEECSVMDVVVLVGQLVGCLFIGNVGELVLEHLELGIDAFSCPSQNHVACCVEVLRQFSETIKVSECSVMYSLQVAESSLQAVVWVGLQSV